MPFFFGLSQHKSIGLIQTSIKKNSELDGQALRASLNLTDSWHPVRANTAYQETIERLSNTSFYKQLKQPAKKSLLQSISTKLACDQRAPMTLLKLGRFQERLQEFSKDSCVKLADVLLEVFGEEYFDTTTDAADKHTETKADGALNSKHLVTNSIIALWRQLPTHQQSAVLERFKQLSEFFPKNKIAERASLCETLLTRMTVAPSITDQLFSQLIASLTPYFQTDLAPSSGDNPYTTSEMSIPVLSVILNHPMNTLDQLLDLTHELSAKGFKNRNIPDTIRIISSALIQYPDLVKNLIETKFHLTIEDTPSKQILTDLYDHFQHMLDTLKLEIGSTLTPLREILLTCPTQEWQTFTSVAAALTPQTLQKNADMLRESQTTTIHNANPHLRALTLAIGELPPGILDRFVDLCEKQKILFVEQLAKVFSEHPKTNKALDSAIIDTFLNRVTSNTLPDTAAARMQHLRKARLTYDTIEDATLNVRSDKHATEIQQAEEVKALIDHTAQTEEIINTLSLLAPHKRLNIDNFNALIALTTPQRSAMLDALMVADIKPQKTACAIQSLSKHNTESWQSVAKLISNYPKLGTTPIEHLIDIPKEQWPEFMALTDCMRAPADKSNDHQALATHAKRSHIDILQLNTAESIMRAIKSYFLLTSASKISALIPLIQTVDKSFSQIQPSAKLNLVKILIDAKLPTAELQALVTSLIEDKCVKEKSLNGQRKFLEVVRDLRQRLKQSDAAHRRALQLISRHFPESDSTDIVPLVLHKKPETLELYLTQAKRFNRPDITQYIKAFDQCTESEISSLVNKAITLDCCEPKYFSQYVALSTEQRDAFESGPLSPDSANSQPQAQFKQLSTQQKLQLAKTSTEQWKLTLTLFNQLKPELGTITDAAFNRLLAVPHKQRPLFCQFLKACYRASEPADQHNLDQQQRFMSRRTAFASLQSVFLKASEQERNLVISLIEEIEQNLQYAQSGQPLMILQHLDNSHRPLPENLKIITTGFKHLMLAEPKYLHTANTFGLRLEAFKNVDTDPMETIFKYAKRFTSDLNYIEIVTSFAKIEANKIESYLDCANTLGQADTILEFIKLFPRLAFSDLPRYTQSTSNFGCTQPAEFECISKLTTKQLETLDTLKDIPADPKHHKRPILEALLPLPIEQWTLFADAYRTLDTLAPFYSHSLSKEQPSEWLPLAQMLVYVFDPNVEQQDYPSNNDALSLRQLQAKKAPDLTKIKECLAKFPDMIKQILYPQLSKIVQHTRHFTPEERLGLIDWLPRSELIQPDRFALFAPSLAAIHAATNIARENTTQPPTRMDKCNLDATRACLEVIAKHQPENPAAVIQLTARLGGIIPETLTMVLDKKTSEAQQTFVRRAATLGLTTRNMHALREFSSQTVERQNMLFATLRRITPHQTQYDTYQVLAQVAEQDLESLAQNYLALRETHTRLTQRVTIRALAGLPAGERATLIDLLQSFTNTQLTDELLQRVVDLPANQRPGTISNILQIAQERTRSAYALDTENVARGDRNNRTAASFGRLLAKYPAPTEDAAKSTLKEVLAYLITIQGTAQDLGFAQNAIKTLTKDKTDVDYSNALLSNPFYRFGFPGLGQMAALVFQLINAYSPPGALLETRIKERQNLRVDFYKAIAGCIETDGHRVCAVGISQRLLSVLQGYYSEVEIDHFTRIEPVQYFNQICQEYNPRKIDEAPKKFYDYAKSAALRYYGHSNEAQYNEFMEKQLNEFFKLSEYQIPGTEDNEPPKLNLAANTDNESAANNMQSRSINAPTPGARAALNISRELTHEPVTNATSNEEAQREDTRQSSI